MEERVYKSHKVLRQLRDNASITQQEIAEVLDLSVDTVGNYERGIILPDMKTIGKWCTACGTTLEEYSKFTQGVLRQTVSGMVLMISTSWKRVCGVSSRPWIQTT